MELMKTPIFFLMISFFAFEIGCIINRKTKVALLNPLFIGIVLVIGILELFKIDYKDYSNGTQMISFLLGPATVVLAVPLYKNIMHLKKHYISILAGIIVGSFSGMISIMILSRLFGLSTSMSMSMVPKSVTTPIGVEISKGLGGIQSITVIAIIITGITGSIIGPAILKLFRIDDAIAVGIAFGTSSHAMGTAKAMEIGELEGAMGSLAIGTAGLTTVVLAPIIVSILHRFL